MGRKQAHPGKKEGAALRRVEATTLRVAGWGYQLIANRFGVSIGQAYQDVQRHIRDVAAAAAEDTAECRRLELARLDHFLERLQAQVTKGETKAIETALKIAKRRADLLGLDAPTKQVVTGDAGGPILVEWGTVLPPTREE